MWRSILSSIRLSFPFSVKPKAKPPSQEILRQYRPLPVQPIKLNEPTENTIAFVAPQRRVSKIFIHCSASDSPEHDSVDVIRQWHLKRGFSDIGYHYFISKDGTIHSGRPLYKIPAAQEGHNTGSIAICLHGLKKDKFTTKQFKSLIALCEEINRTYKREVTFHGHCEVSIKACPVFDYRAVLNLDNKGYMLCDHPTLTP